MITLTLDCTGINNGRIKVSCRREGVALGPLTIEALHCQDELFISNLLIDGLPFDVTEKNRINHNSFTIEYEVTSPFQSFMGSHLDWNLNYPFFNSEEVYIGSGILPVIEGFEEVDGSLWYDLRIIGVPDGWRVSTSLLDGECHTARIPMEKAAQFFFYASRSAHHLGRESTRLVVSNKAELPVLPEEILSFGQKSIHAYERFFGPNEYAKTTLLLILQSPSHFDEITRSKTFSTGENYTGGIALYGPNRQDVFNKLGHPTYLDFLLGGLHHEIGHAYTSAGPARFKSLLYASSDCPRDDRLLIGESLNGYFNGAIRATFDSSFRFSLEIFVSTLTSRLLPGKSSFEMNLFLFDLALREETRISLYNVFCSMLHEKRQRPGPYSSAEFLIESAERLSGHRLSAKIRDLLFAPEPQAYEEKMQGKFKSQGWSLDSLPNDLKNAVDFFLS